MGGRSGQGIGRNGGFSSNVNRTTTVSTSELDSLATNLGVSRFLQEEGLTRQFVQPSEETLKEAAKRMDFEVLEAKVPQPNGTQSDIKLVQAYDKKGNFLGSDIYIDGVKRMSTSSESENNNVREQFKRV